MEWLIIQSFYHGLIRSAREHIDDVARGSFFILSVEEAHKLVEKMTPNQSWNESALRPTPARFTSLKRWTDMLTTKIDLLMKKLENTGLDHLKMVDA
jgi:hypothetical protein